MEKQIRDLIKKAFYTYPTMMNGVVISTVEWAESNMAVDYSKVAVQSSPGNYKETKLCALMDNNIEKLRWCYMVEKTLEHYHFESAKVKFIENCFFKKKSDVLTCIDVGICRATYFNWKEEILETGYKWAKELKLVK